MTRSTKNKEKYPKKWQRSIS